MSTRATTEQLLAALDRIDVEGWEGAAATRLLTYLRGHVVGPQVAATGLLGPPAQAEASGWEAAWQSLAGRYLRTVERPWSVVWVAVRRAVRGEVVSGWFVTGERNGWRWSPSGSATAGNEAIEARRCQAPTSLDLLIAHDRDLAAQPPAATHLGHRLEAIVCAMVAAGWEPREARTVVEGVALTAVRDGKVATDVVGWRPLAATLGVAPWRVRRVMVLLCGAPGWPGLVERMVNSGSAVLDDPRMRAAVLSTVQAQLPPPPRAASRGVLSTAAGGVLAAS